MNIKISDEITLAKRKNTKLFQAVIKAPDGKWRRVSTKTDDPKEAEQFARNKLAEWYVLEKHGMSEVGYTFKHCAEQYLKNLQLSIDDQSASASQQTYVGIIRNWLIPFFGQKKITNIGFVDIEDFERYRRNI